MSKGKWLVLGLAAMNGALVAARIDFESFKDFKEWKDALRYDWGKASFRWFKGAVIGVAGTFAGVSAIESLHLDG